MSMLNIHGDVDVGGHRAVEQLIADRVCHAVEYRRQAESTNSLALADLYELRVRDEDCPKLYLVDEQTAGRGRHGRKWQSNSGTLTFSLAIERPRAERAMKLISLAVGVGVARCLEFEFAPLKGKLKWPNDVLVSGGKVAGILMETIQNAPRHVVVGVGVNINESPDLSDEPNANATRCLAETVGRQLDRYVLLGPIVTSILAAIAELDESADDIVGEFRTRCLLTGQPITFQDGSDRRHGMCQGITDEGELIVQTDRGVRRLHSGEARLVRRP